MRAGKDSALIEDKALFRVVSSPVAMDLLETLLALLTLPPELLETVVGYCVPSSTKWVNATLECDIARLETLARRAGPVKDFVRALLRATLREAFVWL
jgi:hypothetical protein